MSEDGKSPGIGTVAWTDLTVDDAETIRDFYSQVVGWESAPVSMGEYDDFSMLTPGSGTPVAGICHKRGSNAALPSKWMIYMVVENLAQSAARCVELGGVLLVPPKGMGEHGSYCVIQDPAGAVAALFQKAPGKT